MRLERWMVLFVMVGAAGCDGATDPDAGVAVDAGAPEDAGPGGPEDAGSDDAGVPPRDGGSTTQDAGGPVDCDYQAVDGIVVIEAEGLPFVEDWQAGDDADASGGQFIEWTGSSHNNDTSFGRFEVSIRITTPGLYRLQMRKRVGMGTNATEHNDVWIQIPDADAFYGIQGPSDAEDRVYPRPLCEDASFLASIEAMADVTEASCPNGTSRDGYFKVYSSGALDWRWSARTSDSDAHDVVARFDAAGVYTLQFAARADYDPLDRIVLHRVELEDAAVQDLSLAETACP